MKFKRFAFVIILLLSATVLAGCNATPFIGSLVPKDSDVFARQYIEMIRSGDFDAARRAMAPDSVSEDLGEHLKSAHDLLTSGDLVGAELVKFHSPGKIFTSRRMDFLTYEIELSDAWATALVVVEGTGEDRSVLGMLVKPASGSRMVTNAFTFSGKPLGNYAMLFTALLVTIFVIYTAVLCVKIDVNKKWLWLVFILFGIGSITVNWSTGEIGTRAIALLFLGSEALRDGKNGPWMISFSLPIGAMAFYFMHARFNKKLR